MPGKIKVKILAGRNLPVMDRSGDTTDAYVEIKFGNTTYKTDVCRKSLNPQWNSEWYRFEVDDAELQDEPLQVRLMDHDTYSANDAIGKVYVNLNPLLLPGSPLAVKNIWTLEATMNSSSGAQGGSVMTGWIPVFDTMHGIRGEVNIIVKVELFSDCNKFRQSSCGVQFFYSPNIPHGYHAQVIHGFVEELVVCDDPEYKWIDKIRTPRASNEARQTLFLKMSGEVQRKIGLKALDLGGNAVIGYVQNFDLEGESGIVARGIGTAVTLVKLQDITSSLPIDASNIEDLTFFALRSKGPLDFSESDDSLPLLANSPNHSPAAPCSPINTRPTAVSRRFPKYEKSPKRQRRATVRLAEYRATAPRARQFSLQSNAGVNGAPIGKGNGSSSSLADDLVSETSLRNMLALEDMRGEPAGNPFSRGLKNFRYLHQNILPKRVARIKSRFADSLDDESDPDSNYSSAWSLAGSESNRSSIVDLRQSVRRKKFTHKRMSSNDGVAALLIRSVHAGFPLDSVEEDRETPAPSPVNILDDAIECHGDRSLADNVNETGNASVEAPMSREDSAILKNQIIPANEKLEAKYSSDRSIPMISSSESDTSSSDDDEPSESSTNYNILDETFSLVEPDSPNETKYSRGSSKASKNSAGSSEPVASPIKIIKQSFGSEDVAEIIPVREEDLRSRRDCSLESSTDYNILDETSSLLESKFPDDAPNQPDVRSIIAIDRAPAVDPLTTCETPEKVATSRTETNLAMEHETEYTAASLPDRVTEFSADYTFFDDTRSLLDPGTTDNETFPISFHRDVEDEMLPRVALAGLLFEPCLESDRQSLENDETLDDDLYSPVDSSFCEKLTAENPAAESVTGVADEASLILSFDSTEIVEPAGEMETSAEQAPRKRAPSPPDDKLHSSTDHNILDDGSPMERNSHGGENSKRAIPKVFDTANLAASIDIGELVPPLCLSRIDVASVMIEDSERASGKQNFSFDSRSDRNLNSSTDYNVLEDTTSLNEEASSLDETKLESAPQIVETVRPEAFSELTLPPALERIDVVPGELVGGESPPRKNLVAPFSMTPPISNDEKDDLSISCASSRVPQSPRLKFLPKQKRFDSADDPDFVTSTPVETDVTPPDFSPIEKSPESPEYKKWDFPSISPSPCSRIDLFDRLAARIEDGASLDSIAPRTFVVTEKIFDNKGKPMCPLGVTVDRVTTASDVRAGNGAKITRHSETEISKLSKASKYASATEAPRVNERSSRVPDPCVRNADTPPPLKKTTSKKAQKKVERTDTVIYKGPMKDREKTTMRSTTSRDTIVKAAKKAVNASNSIPIIVAPPPDERATRLRVPAIQTTSTNVHGAYSPDETRTRHFGSAASRECQLGEFVLSEKFSRKYRQHCIIDLIKTIDTKMMLHHAHHDRRDSTRSRQRRKRERANASATPSPDSIHRTKSHRRRSRSRSPDRQHAHSKVSPLSIHSFPTETASASNLTFDPPPFDSSCESIPKNDVADSRSVVSGDPPNVALVNDIPSARNDDESTNSKITSNDSPDVPLTSNNHANVDEKTIVPATNKIRANLLLPKDTEYPVFKSHSAGSLDKFGQRSSLPVTKITNTPNTTDDSCVPCSQLTHRQQDEQPSSPLPASSILPSSLGSRATPNAMSTKTGTAVPNMHRRSSDSDLSITPKGNSLAGSDRSMGGHFRPSTAIVRTMNQDTMEMLEYPFITMQHYPSGFLLNIGGLVSARSVKLLERITNLEEPEGRDAWWTEIRMEVRSHARALACNVVLGYKEEISICDDVCVLNASGTAAVINLLNASQDQDAVLSRTIMTTSAESERDKTQAKSSLVKPEKIEEAVQPGQQQSQQQHISGKLKRTSESNDHEVPYLPTVSACSLCHLPYSEASVPFRVDVSKCSICKRSKVPDVLFTTIELPENIPMTGRGVFLQATVCKCKRDLRGELNAKEISDCLPFLEYELHSLLLNKLKVKGMNAIFGLKVQVSVGERLVIGMAVGTAVYLTALPPPSVPQIASGNSWHNEEQLAEIQKNLIETVKKNREFYRLKPIVDIENGRAGATSDTDESDDDLPDLDLGVGTKDACVLEVDDVEDMDRINLLMDEKPPEDFHVVNTQSIPGLEDLEIVRNLQMFTQISRAKIPAGQFASMPSKYFARMLQTVLFKLRRMVPCALCDMQFRVALPEQDEIQLSVVGMALGLGEPTRFSKYKRKIIANSTSKDPIKKTDEADLIFSLDEDQVDVPAGPQETVVNPSSTSISNSSPLTGVANHKHRPRSPFRTKSHMQHRHKHVPLKERYGVDITPLSYLPGGKIERYLGNLNFFFIRESTSIRENGGLSGFTHSFVTEVLAIVRAHITALGGNAMVAFFMTQCVLLHSPHKNQGQCLINVGGDVVTVSYYGDEKYQSNQNC